MKKREFLKLTDNDKDIIFDKYMRAIEWALWKRNPKKREIKLDDDEKYSLKDFILSNDDRAFTWFNLGDQASRYPNLIGNRVLERQVSEIELFLDEGKPFIRFQEIMFIKTINEHREKDTDVELSQFFNHILN